MNQSTMQFILAVLGISGTLAAAITTHVLQGKAERERREAEDARRWQADRFRVAKDLLYKVMETQRILRGTCSVLPSSDERARLQDAGYTTLQNVGSTCVPGSTNEPLVFDTTSLVIVKEDLERVHPLLEEAENLVAEISILSEGSVPMAAKEMLEAAWDAVGWAESTAGSTNDAYNAVLATKEPIAAFEQYVRVELGVTKSTKAGLSDAADRRNRNPVRRQIH